MDLDDFWDLYPPKWKTISTSSVIIIIIIIPNASSRLLWLPTLIQHHNILEPWSAGNRARVAASGPMFRPSFRWNPAPRPAVPGDWSHCLKMSYFFFSPGMGRAHTAKSSSLFNFQIIYFADWCSISWWKDEKLSASVLNPGNKFWSRLPPADINQINYHTKTRFNLLRQYLHCLGPQRRRRQ